MATLYDLEKLAIKNQTWSLHNFAELRNELKCHWEAIIKVMKKCRSYGGDVQLLAKEARTVKKTEATSILGTMGTELTEAMDSAVALRNGHLEIVDRYFEPLERPQDHRRVSSSAVTFFQRFWFFFPWADFLRRCFRLGMLGLLSLPVPNVT